MSKDKDLKAEKVPLKRAKSPTQGVLHTQKSTSGKQATKGIGQKNVSKNTQATTQCKHKNLVVYEIQFGAKLPGNKFMEKHYDWSINILGAHKARVAKYLCADCGTIINMPYKKEVTNAFNPKDAK